MMDMKQEIIYFLSEGSLHYVSHYTSLERFKQICENQTLRMGQLNNVNDFDELQHPGLNIDLSGIDRSGSKVSELADKISSSIYNTYDCNVVVACFSKNNYRNGHITASDTSFGNNVLWGTYAKNLGGVALVFDPNLLQKQIESYFGEIDSNNIIYSNDINYTNGPGSRIHIHSIEVAAKPFEGNSEEEFKLLTHITTAAHAQHLLFNKREMWSPEKEWRVIAVSQNKGPHFIPYGDALKAVVIGPRAHTDPRTIAKAVGCPVFTIGKAGNRPEIDLLDPLGR